MTNKTVFSVVIPLYNKRDRIADTLRSVLNQSHRHFEIIVVDDGSVDGSGDIVRSEFANEPRIRLIRQANGGVSLARNTGIRHSKAEYIAFLDADDTWEPEFLEILCHLIDRFPAAGLYCTNYAFKTGPYLLRAPKLKYLPEGQNVLFDNFLLIGGSGELPVLCSASCVPKRILDEVGGFPVGEKLGEDQELWIRIALKYPFAFSRQVAVVYQSDFDNRTRVHSIPEQELPFSRRLQILLDTGKVPAPMRIGARKYIASHLVYAGALNVRAGKFAVARKILLDRRCRFKPVKQLTWLMMSFVKQYTPRGSCHLSRPEL